MRSPPAPTPTPMAVPPSPAVATDTSVSARGARSQAHDLAGRGSDQAVDLSGPEAAQLPGDRRHRVAPRRIEVGISQSGRRRVEDLLGDALLTHHLAEEGSA